MWVPVKRVEPNCVRSPEDLDATHGFKVGDYRSAEAYVNNVKAADVDGVSSGSLQGKLDSTKGKCADNTFDVSTSTGKGEKSESAVRHNDLVMQRINLGTHENISSMGNVVKQQEREADLVEKEVSLEFNMQNGGDNVTLVSSSTSQKTESSSMQTNPAMRSTSSGMFTYLQPKGCKFSTNTSTQYGDSSNRDNQKGKSGSISDQKRVFSAKQIIFSPRTAICQYRPRNSGGTRIKSVAPGTKPRPRWCPTGLTHTQKRRVQRLRASEIKEDITLKKRDELFRRDRPMVPPNMTWREKHITTEENINADDMVVHRNSEISRDAPIDMDIQRRTI
jgi:hypothetical protein